MPGKFPSAYPPVPPSPAATSGHQDGPDQTQLSGKTGVQTSVSSVAIDRVLLSMASAVPQSPSGPEGLADAEMMLRLMAEGDSAVAEDLAQEVFLRVYRSRGSYEPSAKFTTWLYRIATNLAVNHARDTRHERPETMVSLDEPDEETGASMDVADSSLSVEEKLVRRERLMAIRETVQKLPERQRIAVLMHKYQQMDYKQIAEVLKLSESATKSLLFRAYETLREQLKSFI